MAQPLTEAIRLQAENATLRQQLAAAETQLALRNAALANWGEESLKLVEQLRLAEAEVYRWKLIACSWMHTAGTDLERASLAEERVRRLRAYIRSKCPHHTIGNAPPCYCAEALALLAERKPDCKHPRLGQWVGHDGQCPDCEEQVGAANTQGGEVAEPPC